MFRNVDATTGGSGVRGRDQANTACDVAEHWDSMAAGAELAALLFAADPQLLDPNAQVSFVVACQRLINAVTAVQDQGVVAFVGNNPRDTVYRVEGSEHALTDARALELQLALAWGEGFTRSRIHTARTIATQLPSSAQAVTAGSVQPIVARAIAEGAHTLTASLDEAIAIACQTQAIPADIQALRESRAELLHTYDTTLAAYAPGRSLKQVGSKVRDCIARLDPAGVLARRAKAIRTQSDVRITPMADGMAMLTAIMATEQAHACLRVLDTTARDTSVYDGTDPIGLRRTRVLFDLLTRTAEEPPLGEGGAVSRGDGRAGSLRRTAREESCAEGDVVPTGSRAELRSRHPAPHPANRRGTGIPVHLDVVMNLGTFLGLSEDECVMPGAGTVPAQAVRDLINDAAFVKMRRILTDPRTGHALDIGVRRYRLTNAEQQRIAMRDRTCRMLDCHAPAYRCECDHAKPYGVGGASSTTNLGLLCKRHHQHKTHAGWAITDSEADGSCTWVSPLGREYRHEADPLLATVADEPADADDPPF